MYVYVQNYYELYLIRCFKKIEIKKGSKNHNKNEGNK